MAQRGETIIESEFAITAVKLDVWREFGKQHMLCESDGAFRKAWNTVRNKLVKDGHVAFRGDYVWPTQSRALGDVPF